MSCVRIYYIVSSTNSTLCAQPCYCQTVETHSCVSASCQVFATGDFIRQSCLPRRKNASLQVFVEFTLLYIMYRTGKRPSGRMSLGRYIASRYVPLGRINSRGSAPGCRSADARKWGWATASGRHRRASPSPCCPRLSVPNHRCMPCDHYSQYPNASSS